MFFLPVLFFIACLIWEEFWLCFSYENDVLVQLCFFRQFTRSIKKSDYLALRLGFITVRVYFFLMSYLNICCLYLAFSIVVAIHIPTLTISKLILWFLFVKSDPHEGIFSVCTPCTLTGTSDLNVILFWQTGGTRLLNIWKLNILLFHEEIVWEKHDPESHPKNMEDFQQITVELDIFL